MKTYNIKVELIETHTSFADVVVQVEAESLEEAKKIADQRLDDLEYEDDFEDAKFEVVDYSAEFRLAKDQEQ